MYRYSNGQISLSDFKQPVGMNLKENNRWVKKAQTIPWPEIEKRYAALFTNRKGNCYVHALCLQRLMTEHGYRTKLIWVTDKSHYWNLIKLNGTWKHIDATPGVRHTKYSLMNDAQRLETLQGREWDTSKWPACE